jgi:glycosyltransferase involved in cell wall biosynthesis
VSGPRVLYVNHTGDVSGAEMSLLELLDALPDDVTPALCSPPGRLTGEVPDDLPLFPLRRADPGARLTLRSTPKELGALGLAVRQLRRAVARFAPDVIHANSIRSGLLAAGLPSSGPPVIVHLRDILPASTATAAVRRVVLRRSDALVGNSRYTLEHFVGPDRAAAPRPSVILNPIDAERLLATSTGQDVRRELGIPAEAKVVLHVAQLTRWKAQDDSVRMLAALRRQGVDAHLLLVGEARTPAADVESDNARFVGEVEALITSLGLEPFVHWLGWRSDVADVHRASDVAVLPSWHEPFGRVVAEALCLGVPVLATSEGGTDDVIIDPTLGRLLTPREPERWADALAELLHRPTARADMDAIAASVRERFSPAAHAAATVALYRELAGGSA